MDTFADSGMITRIHRTLSSGKEGTVYCCRGHPSTRRKYLAAKVYRTHTGGTYKLREVYFEGRERALKPEIRRALSARTKFGRDIAEALWVDAEYETLKRLHRAGVSTPEPVARAPRAILMEYIGDGAAPAPPLRALRPTREEARSLFDQVFEGIVGMLQCHLVHADLSPYNVLVWKGRVRMIDVPQAVDPRFNLSSFALLRRDVARICSFFHSFGLDVNADAMAVRLWKAYERADL